MNRLINKYKSIPQAVKASLWFMVCNVIQKGISVLCTPVFTRMMTSEQYGEYAVYLSWFSIVSTVVSLNLAAGVYNNGLTNHPEDSKRITSSFLGLSTTSTILAFIIYLVSANFWNSIFDLPSVLVAVMFIEILTSSAYNLWAAKQRYDYQYVGIIVTCLFIGIGGPLTAFITVLHSVNKSFAMILSFAGVQILVGMVIYIYIFATGKTFFDKKYWKYALTFNLPLIPHYLSQIVLNQADRIMIKNLVGSDATAMYTVAYTISMVMLVVVSAINNTFIPYIYKSIKSKKLKELSKMSSVISTLVFAMCLVAMLCGPELIRILAPRDYYDARWVVPPVAISLFFVFVAGLFGTVEFYFEKTKFVMVASSSAAIANVILNYIFIQLCGFVAAGYTTLVCYIVLMIVHFIFYKKLCRQYNDGDEVYNNKVLFKLGIALLITTGICLFVYDIIFVRYIILLFIVVFIILKRNVLLEVIKNIKN